MKHALGEELRRRVPGGSTPGEAPELR
jgi:hypothetical protein